jgi:hypothetical protein
MTTLVLQDVGTVTCWPIRSASSSWVLDRSTTGAYLYLVYIAGYHTYHVFIGGSKNDVEW